MNNNYVIKKLMDAVCRSGYTPEDVLDHSQRYFEPEVQYTQDYLDTIAVVTIWPYETILQCLSPRDLYALYVYIMGGDPATMVQNMIAVRSDPGYIQECVHRYITALNRGIDLLHANAEHASPIWSVIIQGCQRLTDEHRALIRPESYYGDGDAALQGVLSLLRGMNLRNQYTFAWRLHLDGTRRLRSQWAQIAAQMRYLHGTSALLPYFKVAYQQFPEFVALVLIPPLLWDLDVYGTIRSGSDKELLRILWESAAARPLQQSPIVGTSMRHVIMDQLDVHSGVKFPLDDHLEPDLEARLKELMMHQNAWRLDHTDLSGYTYSTWEYTYNHFPHLRPFVVEQMVEKYTLSHGEERLMQQLHITHTNTTYPDQSIAEQVEQAFAAYFALYA